MSSALASSTLGDDRPLSHFPSFIDALHPDTLYSPAQLADLATDLGFFDRLSNKGRNQRRLRLRKNLCQLCHRRGFPKCGDGQVLVKGQPVPGWTGARWRGAVDPLPGDPHAMTLSPQLRELMLDMLVPLCEEFHRYLGSSSFTGEQKLFEFLFRRALARARPACHWDVDDPNQPETVLFQRTWGSFPFLWLQLLDGLFYPKVVDHA